MEKELAHLSALKERLLLAKSYDEKIALLDADLPFENLSTEERYLLGLLVAIGQKHAIDTKEPKELIRDLKRLEAFYGDLGGIIGYQCLALSSLLGKKSESYEYHPPEGIDIREETEEVLQAIIAGIEHLPEMAEIYPVGGAADRLQLKEEETGKDLPAARLKFYKRNLLEHLISDLEAREYLYYKLFNKEVVTPIAMMTSEEKRSHEHVIDICEQNNWFGRPKDSFRFVCQPLVPTFTKEGKWCLTAPGKLLLKPGGHGVIWKLAQDGGVFSWLKALGKTKTLIRQINNPIAGTDFGLLAFCGIGHRDKKAFGFASCLRQVRAKEGMNVVRCSPSGKCSLTNIEYCEFEKHGIEDRPQEGSTYSLFPSNTNILFADLKAAEEITAKNPYPGLLINFKESTIHDPKNGPRKEPIARLESTMQNIADHFESLTPTNLPSYLTFNHRHKTISATKRELTPDTPLLETPEGSFYDTLKNAHELLTACHFNLPPLPSPETFLEKGPSFLFTYHPALGPLYSIIAQKIRQGHLAPHSELQLEIADLLLENLSLNGSLLILTDHITGHKQNGILHPSNRTGRCILKNVTIKNRGLKPHKKPFRLKTPLQREETCLIKLNENSLFIAEDLTLDGNQSFEVPPDTLMRLTSSGPTFEKLENAEPLWDYSITPDHKIHLEMK